MGGSALCKPAKPVKHGGSSRCGILRRPNALKKILIALHITFFILNFFIFEFVSSLFVFYKTF